MLGKYNKIWDEVSNGIKKEFDNKRVESKKHLTTKLKTYKRKRKTFFHNGEIPKEDSDCICLSLIIILVYDKELFNA